jgi:protein Tex
MTDTNISLPAAETRIAGITGLPEGSVRAATKLFSEGATVPFVARYRKEVTGNLDEEQLRTLLGEMERIAQLDTRREAILASMNSRELLTPALKQAIAAAETLHHLEDIYSPYRPRRATRADKAREAGLAPAARAVLQRPADDPEGTILRESPKGTPLEAARDGVVDILAAQLAADPDLRGDLFAIFQRQGAIRTTRARGVTEAEAATFRDYFDWKEPARSARPHRLLAIFRGEKSGQLSVSVRPPEAAALRITLARLVALAGDGELPSTATPHRRWHVLAERVAAEAWQRLLAPSLENRIKRELREYAEEQSTVVFAAALRETLLAPPFGSRPVLAIDPGFRTGSKVVALSATGDILHHETIYPVAPHDRRQEAAERLRAISADHGPEGIAVGNGTAGREIEEFLADIALTDATGSPIPVIRVNEAGASVYSASPEARREMPDLAIEYRGSVSIGRRLQDPLAELVKVDPAAIGVGQYQHDIDPRRLARALEDTVESCVNAVGVEINTAGEALLARVAGLDARSARGIVAHRREGGPFPRRDAILDVPGIGARRWEQAAGFLRCRRSADPRDRTAIHPDHYPLVDEMAASLGVSVQDLVGTPELVDRIPVEGWVRPDRGVGEPTLRDILEELRRGGGDTRGAFEAPAFDRNIRTIGDLTVGLELTGTVGNVTAFGAFVDIGVHRDGLVHISELADRYVKDPHEVVHVGQTVTVRVTGIDVERERISLSMKRKDP